MIRVLRRTTAFLEPKSKREPAFDACPWAFDFGIQPILMNGTLYIHEWNAQFIDSFFECSLPFCVQGSIRARLHVSRRTAVGSTQKPPVQIKQIGQFPLYPEQDTAGNSSDISIEINSFGLCVSLSLDSFFDG